MNDDQGCWVTRPTTEGPRVACGKTPARLLALGGNYEIQACHEHLGQLREWAALVLADAECPCCCGPADGLGICERCLTLSVGQLRGLLLARRLTAFTPVGNGNNPGPPM